MQAAGGRRVNTHPPSCLPKKGESGCKLIAGATSCASKFCILCEEARHFASFLPIKLGEMFSQQHGACATRQVLAALTEFILFKKLDSFSRGFFTVFSSFLHVAAPCLPPLSQSHLILLVSPTLSSRLLLCHYDSFHHLPHATLQEH